MKFIDFAGEFRAFGGSPSPATNSTILAGVDNAFVALREPEKHAKILIDPTSMATMPGN
jgi:hypothetical protein